MNQVIKKASWDLVRVISLDYLGPEKKEKAQHSRTPNPEQLKAKHPLQLSCKQCLSPSLSLPLSLHLCSSSWVDFEVLQKKPGESSLFNI
jgi:hypothetical protein